MSYATSGLRLVSAGVGSGPSMWVYTSADAHTAVDETDYFSDGKARGMKASDVVIVVDTSADTTTLHHVLAIDADGNASISSATLA
jgi:hypothetical protein